LRGPIVNRDQTARIGSTSEDEPAGLCRDPADDRWRRDVEALYRQRADQLIRRVAAGTGRETARDVVHEAFAKFAGLTGVRRLGVARPEAYVYRICLNLVRDLSRSRDIRARAIADAGIVEAKAHDPIIQLEQRDELRRLEAAALRLKPKTRAIFLAKRLDGMSYADIAERTGLSLKGVEKHMTKAIASIDRAMKRRS
jgi:RNA polymerase sigma-70 factor (ECF subfamily)